MYVSNLYTRLCFCIELYFNMLQVDVDDAWNLVGCLDTHLERICYDVSSNLHTSSHPDVSAIGWGVIGKHACVDLTGVSPLVGLRDHGFVAGQAITKAEAGKVAKHEKACIENQHVFAPFAFDTFGALAPDAVRFLKRVQQVVSSNTAHVKGQNFVFSRVGFAIQKGVAAQLVARLPAISL
ncbi:putative exostosin [Helianthus anomalus]